jgi:hypothetical protein
MRRSPRRKRNPVAISAALSPGWLVETVVVSLTGELAGIALGWAAPFASFYVAPRLRPARYCSRLRLGGDWNRLRHLSGARASGLNPIDALRYE